MDSGDSSDTETSSSTSSEVCEEDYEEVLQRMNELHPYLFEPTRELSSSDETSYEESEHSDDEILNNRLTSSDWYVLYLLML